MFTELEKCPRSLLVCEKSNFLHEKSRHAVHVSKHYFNYKISLFIPDCGTLPSSLANVIDSFNKYYLIRDFPVFELLQEDFLENVVKKDALYGLSYKTRIDQDNTVALLPNRQLILSLDKDTYELLGLEGKPSQYSHRQPMRYVVTIDQTNKSMAPGKKFYQLVLTNLKDRVLLKTDLLLARYNTGLEESPSLRSLLSRHQYKEHSPSVTKQTIRNLPIPTLNPSDLTGNALSCEPHHFLEWLGAVNMGIGCDNTAVNFLSTYVCPEPWTMLSHAQLCTVSGLLLPEDIHSLLEELRRYMDESGSLQWLSLTVHGFVDSPVGWDRAEHGFHKSGDNFSSFVLFQKQDYWLHMGAATQDGCPP